MTVDPLYILLMMEAILVLTVLLILVIRRAKAEPVSAPAPEPVSEPVPEPVQDSDMIRRSLFLRMLEENIKDIQKNSGIGEDGEGAESQGLLLDQVYNLNMDLLKSLSEALQKEETNAVESLSESLTVKFRVSVNDRLLSFMRALEEQPLSSQDFDPASPENRLVTRETYDRIQKNVTNVVNLNKEMKEQILNMQGEEALSEEGTTSLTKNMDLMTAFIGDLENSNRELELCVNTLEKANDDLSNQLAELTQKLNQKDPSDEPTEQSDESTEPAEPDKETEEPVEGSGTSAEAVEQAEKPEAPVDGTDQPEEQTAQEDQPAEEPQQVSTLEEQVKQNEKMVEEIFQNVQAEKEQEQDHPSEEPEKQKPPSENPDNQPLEGEANER